jgi:extradiol dioxygenase family protein
MSDTRFHLALPVDDLAAAATFYGDVLACPQGRSSSRWIDFDFHGHQLVVHLVDHDAMPAVSQNPVDGEQVPASHFGLILPWSAFDALVVSLVDQGVEFVIEPTTRFQDRQGEQRTLFIRDPAGNHLEFKTFRNIDMLFAVDGLDYP